MDLVFSIYFNRLRIRGQRNLRMETFSYPISSVFSVQLPLPSVDMSCPGYKPLIHLFPAHLPKVTLYIESLLVKHLKNIPFPVQPRTNEKALGKSMA